MTRSKTSTVSERAVKATTSRHVNLAWPWMLWIAMWVFAEATYALFHYLLPDYLPWMSGFTVLAGVIVTASVWKMTHDRIQTRKDTHALRGMVYATGTAAVASFWVFAAMIGNPLSPGLGVAWGFGGFLVCVLWTIRMVMERKDAQASEDGRPSRQGHAAALLESITGDPQIRAEITRADDEMIDLHVDLTESDMSQRDLQGMTEKLAASVGRPAHAAVVMPDPQHAGMATARVLRVNILEDPIPWPGPTSPGGTPFDPIEVGRYITGDTARLWVADTAGVRQKCRVGMPGSGKGNGTQVEVANAITWQETTVIWIDVRKGFQTCEPLVPALDWFIPDKDTARAVLGGMMDRFLEGRFNQLGVMGEPAWRPGCGMQFVWIQVEEASFLDLPDDYVDSIGKSARSAGVHLEWSLQSSLHTQMSTTLRRMFSLWRVYGCQDGFEVSNLPEELAMAGVDPAKWRDEQPGMNYLSGKGIDRRTQATELRDYNPTRQQLAELAAQWGSQPLDRFSADLLGDLYHGRVAPVEMLRRAREKADRPQPAPATVSAHATPGAHTNVAVLERDTADEDDDYDYRGTDVGKLSDADLGITTEYEGLPMDLSYEEALRLRLPPGENVPIGDPDEPTYPGYQPDEESVTWIRDAVEKQIKMWEEDGRRFLRPADFVDTDLCGPLGPKTRGRTWFAKECRRLVDTGRLRYDESVGKYLIIPPAGPAK